MLVITRKPAESIKIADDIYVIVVDIRGDKVRLGIDAPPNVKINRMELLKDESSPFESWSRRKPEKRD